MAEKDKMMDIEILRQTELGGEQVDAVKVVVVLGAGTMGQGISQLVASKGMEVVLIERTEEKARLGLEALEKSMDEEIARWTMTESEKKAILRRVRVTSKIEDVVHGDLVIEAIDENL